MTEGTDHGATHLMFGADPPGAHATGAGSARRMKGRELETGECSVTSIEDFYIKHVRLVSVPLPGRSRAGPRPRPGLPWISTDAGLVRVGGGVPDQARAAVGAPLSRIDTCLVSVRVRELRTLVREHGAGPVCPTRRAMPARRGGGRVTSASSHTETKSARGEEPYRVRPEMSENRHIARPCGGKTAS
jgi:hypothetical protein